MAVTVDLTKFNLNDNIGGAFEAVTAADDTEQTIKGKYPRAIFVGNGGDLVLYNDVGVAVTFENVPDAFFAILNYTGVASTDTLASGIVKIG